MSDSENGLKWWIRYVIVPLIGSGGLIAILVAIIDKDETAPVQPASTTDISHKVETPQAESTTQSTMRDVAESLSGQWRMWANEQENYEFELVLHISGSSVSGKMLRNGEVASSISGRIDGTEIIFWRTNAQLRQPQKYDGSIVREGDTLILRGRYSHNGVFEPHAKWEARKE